MEYCKSCDFYDKEYDDFWRSLNDVGDPANRYCIHYDNCIPKKIRTDKAECPYYVNKAEMDELRRRFGSDGDDSE